MNKYISSLLILCSLSCQAQIVLPENKSLQQLSSQKPELMQVSGIGRYNATIIGYAISCNLSKDDNKIIYDNFFNTLAGYNLKPTENTLIQQQFAETIAIAKEKGVDNSKMTCDTFKVEFDKIVKFLKEKK